MPRAVGLVKQCSRCREFKGVARFNKGTRKGSGVDGLYTWCRDCEKSYRKENRERLLKERRTRYAEDAVYRDNVLQKNKEHRLNNKELVRVQKRLAYLRNRRKYAIYGKEYGRKNAKRIAERNKYLRDRRAIAISFFEKLANRSKLTGRTKHCSGCNMNKDTSYFHKDKYKRDGMVSRCKDCINAKKRRYDEGRKERWVEKNRERHKQSCRARRDRKVVALQLAEELGLIN